MEKHAGSAAVFWGCLLLLSGVAVIGGLLNDNDYLKVKWRVWDTSEQVWGVGGGFGVLLGTLFLIFGCGGSQPEVIDMGHRNSGSADPVGLLLTVAGLTAYVTFAILWARRGMASRWCERLAKGGFYALLVGLTVLLVSLNTGCCARIPGPTDPVTVQIVACEPTLGGTSGQYMVLEQWRERVGVCEAAMADQNTRQAIRAATEHDVDRLGREFDIYRVQGRTDCYCGPVCEEMTKFIQDAETYGCGPW